MSSRSTRLALTGRRGLAIGALVTVVAISAACSGQAETSESPAAPVASTVNVTLREFSVEPDVTSVPAGTVTFVASNTGPEDVHEFVVIQTDLAADALPVDGDGKVTEDGEGMTIIGEVEDVEVGGSKSVDLTLAPGKYVLICNILQTEPDGSLEAHYTFGMRTAFEVN